MSEADNIIETEQPTPTVLSHRRILWTMGAVALLSSLAGFIFVSWQFGLGVVLGGVLSLVNYYWLKISLKKIFDQAVGGRENLDRYGFFHQKMRGAVDFTQTAFTHY